MIHLLTCHSFSLSRIFHTTPTHAHLYAQLSKFIRVPNVNTGWQAKSADSERWRGKEAAKLKKNDSKRAMKDRFQYSTPLVDSLNRAAPGKRSSFNFLSTPAAAAALNDLIYYIYIYLYRANICLLFLTYICASAAFPLPSLRALRMQELRTSGSFPECAREPALDMRI